MTEELFHSDLVPEENKPFFQDLEKRFPEHELWIRRENYERWLSAGLVDRLSKRSVTIHLFRTKKKRLTMLTQSEVDDIFNHFTTEDDDTDDMTISL